MRNIRACFYELASDEAPPISPADVFNELAEVVQPTP